MPRKCQDILRFNKFSIYLPNIEIQQLCVAEASVLVGPFLFQFHCRCLSPGSSPERFRDHWRALWEFYVLSSTETVSSISYHRSFCCSAFWVFWPMPIWQKNFADSVAISGYAMLFGQLHRPVNTVRRFATFESPRVYRAVVHQEARRNIQSLESYEKLWTNSKYIVHYEQSPAAFWRFCWNANHLVLTNTRS